MSEEPRGGCGDISLIGARHRAETTDVRAIGGENADISLENALI